MKRFIGRIAIFISITSFVLVFIIFCTNLIISKASFILPSDKNIIILGDSRTESAIDDVIFNHSVNISESGTAYLYSFGKLKKFLDENKHIDKVLLSFHYNLTEEVEQEWIFSNSSILSHVPQYYMFMDKEDLDTFKYNQTFAISLLKIPVKNFSAIFKFVKNGSISYKDLSIGKYQRTDGNRLQKNIPMPINNGVEEIKEDNISVLQLKYLLKIINLCKQKNVELILISTPIYNSKTYGFKKELNTYYNTYLHGTKYLDFSDFSLPEYGYLDEGHLNSKGAEIFSEFLNDNYNG